MPVNILGAASHGLRPTSSVEGTTEEKAGTWERCSQRLETPIRSLAQGPFLLSDALSPDLRTGPRGGFSCRGWIQMPPVPWLTGSSLQDRVLLPALYLWLERGSDAGGS